jgi:hypothetical protein
VDPIFEETVKVFLKSDLGSAGNEVLFLAEGGGSRLLCHHYWGHVLRQTWGNIFSQYTWNEEGNFRNFKRSSLRGIESLLQEIQNTEAIYQEATFYCADINPADSCPKAEP